MSKHYLVGEGTHSFFIQHEKDQTPFQVAKQGLDERALAKIRGLPRIQKMSDGGEVQEMDGGDSGDADSSEEQAAPQPGPAPQDPSAQPAMPFGGLSGQDLEQYVQSNPGPVATTGVNGANPGVDPTALGLPQAGQAAPGLPQAQGAPQTGTGNGSDLVAALGPYGEPIKMEMDGIRGMAGAKSAESTAVAKAIQDNQDQLKGVNQEYATQRAKIQNESDQLYGDIKNGKIDPQRIWSNMSTGNRVLAGISMLLGGIQSGLNGQPNAALGVLNKAVDQDIDAQKANLSNKHSLFSMNMQRYNNVADAEAATRLQMNTALRSQIDLAAARSGSAQAQAQAKIATGQLLNTQAIPLIMQLSHRATMQNLAAGNVPSVNQENLSPDERARVVQTPMGVRLAPTKEDADAVKKSLTSLTSIDKQLNDMVQFQNQKAGVLGTFPGTTNNADANSMRDNVILELNNLHGLSRLNDNEFNTYKEMVPSPGAFRSTRALAQMMRLKDLIHDKLNAEYSTHLEGSPQAVNSTPLSIKGYPKQ